MVVVDIQGVGDLYTDPQIHTKTGEDFGLGNLGPTGINRFSTEKANHMLIVCANVQIFGDAQVQCCVSIPQTADI